MGRGWGSGRLAPSPVFHPGTLILSYADVPRGLGPGWEHQGLLGWGVGLVQLIFCYSFNKSLAFFQDSFNIPSLLHRFRVLLIPCFLQIFSLDFNFFFLLSESLDLKPALAIILHYLLSCHLFIHVLPSFPLKKDFVSFSGSLRELKVDAGIHLAILNYQLPTTFSGSFKCLSWWLFELPESANRNSVINLPLALVTSP